MNNEKPKDWGTAQKAKDWVEAGHIPVNDPTGHKVAIPEGYEVPKGTLVIPTGNAGRKFMYSGGRGHCSVCFRSMTGGPEVWQKHNTECDACPATITVCDECSNVEFRTHVVPKRVLGRFLFCSPQCKDNFKLIPVKRRV